MDDLHSNLMDSVSLVDHLEVCNQEDNEDYEIDPIIYVDYNIDDESR